MPGRPALCAARAALFERQREQFLDAVDEPVRARFIRLCRDPDFAAELAWVWSASEFAANVCRRQPQDFLELADTGAFGRPHPAGALEAALATELDGCGDEDRLGRLLRSFRNRQMLRMVWRDLTRRAHLEETLAALTELAEVCVRGALRVNPAGVSCGGCYCLLLLQYLRCHR